MDWGLVWLAVITVVLLLGFWWGFRYDRQHQMPGPPVLSADDD